MTPVGMMNGMTKAKIAITISEDLLVQVKDAVARGEAPSVSAYISGAVAYSLGKREGKRPLQLYIDMVKAEHGEPPPEAYAWADEQLRRMGITPPPRPVSHSTPAR